MLKKGKQDIQDEKIQYATYSQWCKMTGQQKSTAIEEASNKITLLTADVGKAATDAEVLGEEIAGHQQQIDSLTAQISSANEVRKQEAKDNAVTLKDFAESIDAISKATAKIKATAQKKKEGTSLLQIGDAIGDSSGAKAVKALLSKGVAPEVPVYEPQSKGILTLLDDLETRFMQEKVKLAKAEAEKASSHELAVKGMQNEIDAETKEKDRKLVLKGSKLEAKASLEDEKSTTTDSKDADTKYLDDLQTTCRHKASDFESNQKLRAEELEVIQKALDVLSEKLSLIETRLKSFLQVKQKSTALAFLRSQSDSKLQDDDNKAKVLAFLQGEAERLHSTVLQSVLQPATTTATINSIKEMLENLLGKLQQQVSETADKRAWCDKELESSKQTRSAKTTDVEELEADSDRLNASIQSLGEDIVLLQSELVDLEEAMTKAIAMREKEKTTNAATIAEAQKAQAAADEALGVLKEFYEQQGTSLVQTKDSSSTVRADQPAIFDSRYAGMDQRNGPIGLLESISADFARLETDTDSEEKAAAEEHEQFTQDYKVNKVEKEADLKNTKEKQVKQSADLAIKSADLESANAELAAAQEYFDQLKPQCLDTSVAYEAEARRRQEDIETLEKALEMLQ
eukprot:TRINITY_DN79688_c0_g1_i1.p1 TRINITY_DN79688_c0_g1~~TRINITY_DN79688_c0_g1_i1.p1  ORF type:complete len:690 (-),score=236.08 TRINITY_DN79688_c0_g1_i1:35-1921(-)